MHRALCVPAYIVFRFRARGFIGRRDWASGHLFGFTTEAGKEMGLVVASTPLRWVNWGDSDLSTRCMNNALHVNVKVRAARKLLDRFTKINRLEAGCVIPGQRLHQY
jgi:hypothetical protein